jgi:hypothetical protein
MRAVVEIPPPEKKKREKDLKRKLKLAIFKKNGMFLFFHHYCLPADS